MRPEPHDNPASICELLSRIQITRHIARNLRTPVIDMGLRLDIVRRATVPEAAINEYSELRADEQQISGAPN